MSCKKIVNKAKNFVFYLWIQIKDTFAGVFHACIIYKQSEID